MVDVVNTEYEYSKMFCELKLKKGYPAVVALNEVRTNIINCIAPWYYTSESPELGKSISLMDLRGAIKKCEAVSSIEGIKLIQIINKQKKPKVYDDIDNEDFIIIKQEKSNVQLYERKVDEAIGNEDLIISPSKVWSILSPSANQYVLIVGDEDTWRVPVEIGDFEIGDTFIIESPSSDKESITDTMDC